MRTILGLTLLIATATALTGCATHRDFDHLDARSDSARETIAGVIERVGDGTPDDRTRARRLAYAQKLNALHLYVEMASILAETVPMTAGEYDDLNRLMIAAYDVIELYAAFPGEADPETGEFFTRPEGEHVEVVLAELDAELDR